MKELLIIFAVLVGIILLAIWFLRTAFGLNSGSSDDGSGWGDNDDGDNGDVGD